MNNFWKYPETIYSHLMKFAERFKNNHLKVYNITDKAQQRLLFLDSIGEATLDILEQLSHMGTGLDRAINASWNKFKESQNPLYNISQILLHQTRKGRNLGLIHLNILPFIKLSSGTSLDLNCFLLNLHGHNFIW